MSVDRKRLPYKEIAELAFKVLNKEPKYLPCQCG